MRSASVRFYGPLNDFLPAARRQATLVCAVEGRPSAKDLVEALGVPHPEIDLLVVNGRPEDFGYRVRDGDRLAVYPAIRAFELGDIARLRPAPQTEPRFVADVHLGRLTAYLRLAGFDTEHRNDYRDDELVAVSASDDRTLLHLLPERTREYYREFSRCPTCSRIYWQGSHYARMRLFIETAFAAATGKTGRP